MLPHKPRHWPPTKGFPNVNITSSQYLVLSQALLRALSKQMTMKKERFYPFGLIMSYIKELCCVFGFCFVVWFFCFCFCVFLFFFCFFFFYTSNSSLFFFFVVV